MKDILCIVRDTVDSEIDKKLAEFVVNSHIKNHPLYNEEMESEMNISEEVISLILINN